MKPRASFQPEALQIHKHLILNLFEPLPTDPSPNPDMLSRNTRGTSGARCRMRDRLSHGCSQHLSGPALVPYSGRHKRPFLMSSSISGKKLVMGCINTGQVDTKHCHSSATPLHCPIHYRIFDMQIIYLSPITLNLLNVFLRLRVSAHLCLEARGIRHGQPGTSRPRTE